jgi:hypothetical protein
MIEIVGEVAEVRWVYLQAARLTKWRAVRQRDEPDAAFTATILDADTFRLAQSPLLVVVKTEAGTWRWPMTDVQISGTTLSARVRG